MKIIKFTKTAILTLSFILLSTANVFSQDSFEDNVDDETLAAPIDKEIYLGFIGSVFLGYFFLKRREKIS